MAARPQHGAPLALWAAACIALLVGAVAIGVALGGVMPLPYGPAAPVQQYVAEQRLAVLVIAVGVFASSVPLAGYAATAGARLRELGATASSSALALAGGILAAGTLGATGLVGWVLSRPDVGDAALVRALYYLAFLIGGPAHIVALGLLVAGMSVPAVALGLLPRPLAWIGLALAAFAELATLVLVWPILGVMLPIARVTALAWLLLAGMRLRRNERRSG
ncbi:hypothetical protein MFM001_14820 [Mycobacterium sp. MFM001]|uniref:hypothetical protein n=1 Tax=Mycobacterium sp. MFM001 TaxID=2049453 RepID=UPI000DA462B0|nr:hypothetical protein [Mycobacterium sp. MFM001]GBE65020.1 hypothetical protein MFM001_14820 [Mycobacterium sp. MFM001]